MPETPDPHPELAPQQPVSLSELTEAFAQAMGVDPSVEDAPPAEEAEEPEAAEPESDEPEVESEPVAQDDPCEISPQSILEAMLFVGDPKNEPLSPAGAAERMRGVEAEEVPRLVEELNRRYTADGCPYRIEHVGSGYRFMLRETFQAVRNRFYGQIREARLSQAAVDTLAIVAYEQPLTAEQINRLRGRPCNHVLSQLVRRGLLRIERRDPKRRTASYFTTDRFLKLFGLEQIDDLPQTEDLDHQ